MKPRLARFFWPTLGEGTYSADSSAAAKVDLLPKSGPIRSSCQRQAS